METDDFSLFGLSIFDGASHVAVMEAYFDASESREGYLTVAGYIFERRNVRPFESLWCKMIREHPPITYFHMTDCASGQDEFKGVDCDQCARKAIRAISMKATQGIIAGVKIADFKELMAADGFMPSPFSLCAHSALMLCAQWAEDHAPDATFAYVFEAGDDYQADANRILDAIGEDLMRSQLFRYKSHAFHPKRKSYPVQAADIIAWHSCKQLARDDAGKGIRGDFQELLKNVKTNRFTWTRDDMRHSVDEPARIHGTDKVGKVAGLYIRRIKANTKGTDQKIASILRQGG